MIQMIFTNEHKEGKVFFGKPDYKSLINEGFMCIDMHTHTFASSDSILKPKTILEKCLKKGFGVAITDHNSINGVIKIIELKNSNPKYKNIPIIPGIEVTTKEAVHLVVYFKKISELKKFHKELIKNNYNRKNFMTNHKIDHLIKKAKKYECFTSLPHPFSSKTAGIKKIKNLDESKYIKDIDLIEVLNTFTLKKQNLLSIEWAKDKNKGVVGGTDSHTISTYGNTITCSKAKNISEFLDNLYCKDCFIIGQLNKLRHTIPCVIFGQSIFLFKANPINRVMYGLRNLSKIFYNFFNK
jgi:predicted metal-dependent phosphoesterase TrpH